MVRSCNRGGTQLLTVLLTLYHQCRSRDLVANATISSVYSELIHSLKLVYSHRLGLLTLDSRVHCLWKLRDCRWGGDDITAYASTTQEPEVACWYHSVRIVYLCIKISEAELANSDENLLKTFPSHHASAPWGIPPLSTTK